VPGMPIAGLAVRELSVRLLLPAAIKVSGLRMDAIRDLSHHHLRAVGVFGQNLPPAPHADLVQLDGRRSVLGGGRVSRRLAELRNRGVAGTVVRIPTEVSYPRLHPPVRGQ